MKKLHLLFVRSFIGPFIGTFFVSLFLFLMQTLWKHLEDLVGKGLEVSVILEFLFYSAIHLIPLALPLAILLSSIMTFGNLGERYELAAIKSAGVSLMRAMRPMFVICIILAISAFYTSNQLIPKANLSWGALLYDVTQKKPALNITPNTFYKDLEGYAIRIGKKHDDGQTIEDILIYAYHTKNKGNNDIIIARKGRMYVSDDERYLHLELEDGLQYQEMVKDENYKRTMPHNTMQFSTYRMSIDMTALQFNRTKKELFKDDYRMLNVVELRTKIDSLNQVIARKKENLGHYLQPYFRIPPDSLQLEDTAIQARLDQLLSYSKALKEKRHDSTAAEPPAASGIMGNMAVVKTDMRAQIALTRETLVDRAMLNVQNMERISFNNRKDTKNQYELRAKYEAEWHKKYTLAISCILLFFIGAPLGAIIRKGGFGLPLVISILLFIVYFIINVFGEKLVKQGELDAVVGMWMSTFILFPFALFLTYKASTDSKLFDAEFYQRIAKIFKRK